MYIDKRKWDEHAEVCYTSCRYYKEQGLSFFISAYRYKIKRNTSQKLRVMTAEEKSEYWAVQLT